jgi:hypothetical protein
MNFKPVAGIAALAIALLAALPAQAGASVNVCALVTQKEVTAVLGGIVLPAVKEAPRGPTLGGCVFPATGGKSVGLHAWPASLYARAVSANHMTSVSGLGVPAAWDARFGLIVKPKGKSYFLQIQVLTPSAGIGKSDKTLSIKIARKALS